MNNLLSLKFWFNLRPGNLSPAMLKYFFIFIVILIILTFVFWLLKSRDKKNLYNHVWQKLHLFSFTNLIIGLFLLFFVYELIPFLSARFWFIIWGSSMIAWLFFISLTFIKIPKIKQKRAEEKKFKKYIP